MKKRSSLPRVHWSRVALAGALLLDLSFGAAWWVERDRAERAVERRAQADAYVEQLERELDEAAHELSVRAEEQRARGTRCPGACADGGGWAVDACVNLTPEGHGVFTDDPWSTWDPAWGR